MFRKEKEIELYCVKIKIKELNFKYLYLITQLEKQIEEEKDLEKLVELELKRSEILLESCTSLTKEEVQELTPEVADKLLEEIYSFNSKYFEKKDSKKKE